MDKIGVYISAYNAENTLEKAIDSILEQTYQNFDIYIGENGSTDSTFEIVKEYCRKYENIYCYRHTQNFTGSFMSSLYAFNGKNDYNITLFYKYDINDNPLPCILESADWLCFVDSDDTLNPEYLEIMLNYAKDNDLDMVTCGWDFVRPERIDHRIPEKNEIIYRSDFSDRMPYYDKFMGPVWNKLFKHSTISRNISYYENKFSALFKEGVYFYGADTAFNYIYLGNNLEKFGLISRSLYNYNISDESVSRKRFHPMRIISDRRMAEVRLDYLMELGNGISDINRDFIMNIYFKSVNSTIELLKSDDRYDLKNKMRYMYEMFNYNLFNDEFARKEKKYL